MSEPTYRQALGESWKLSWRHKGLWAFGLFAMILGQMGVVDIFLKMGITANNLGGSDSWTAVRLIFSPRFWRLVADSLNPGLDTWVWLFWLIITLLGFAGMVLFVAVSCQGAIVHAAAKYAKRGGALPNDSKAWHAGVSHFWGLLVLNILKKLSLLLIGGLIVSIAFGLGSVGVFGRVLYIIAFIVALFASLILSFLLVYAAGYLVVENEKILTSVRLAWQLFARHWLVSFEVGLVVLLTNVALLFIMLAAVVYLFFLPMLVADYIAIWTGAVWVFKIGIGAGYVILLVFAFLASAIFSVFTTSVWTYLFTKMHSHGVTSKLLRIMGKSRV
ncbi:MAG: hypothetical protein AAB390_00130 [Patescibacteria group bacterium]